ncbi:MAG: thioesterase family protein [Brevundimonas sp.]|uniref:acyl-CoA thioesterase n=1 Tax=Brevundimonas sp. TaxID=1871086 RepID=UPI002ABBB8C4|nr:thioesterase family protein [Brevundimonas sp.]MDZ4112305.1 thioesterase family protein [Brevundimonas sp.]
MSGQVFTVDRRVRFADCDAAGIVFFPRYFEMLNGVVEDWFAGPLEASFRELHVNREVSVPTAAVEARFMAPSRLEDDLTFSLTVNKLGGASCGLRHVIACDGQRRFEATQTIVYVGRSLKPEPWPDALRARIQPFLETQP